MLSQYTMKYDQKKQQILTINHNILQFIDNFDM